MLLFYKKQNAVSEASQSYKRLISYKNNPERAYLIAFWVIFALCVLVRVVYYPSVPGGLNQDEASMGYDAYATAFYGIDRNGYRFPVYAMSWGSGQNVLMMYFTAVFVRLFGLNVFSVRLTSLIFGVAAPVVFYHLVKRFHPDNTEQGRKIPALCAFFLLSVAPWHIMLSRWALESNLLPVMFLIGIYLLVLAVQKNSTRYYCLSAGVFALSMYAYATVCIMLPLFLLGVMVVLIKKKRMGVKQALCSGAVFFILSIPMVLFFAVNLLGLSSIRTPLFSVPRLTVMRSTVSFDSFSQNAGRLIELLIRQTDNLPWNGIEGFGIAYLFLLPFAFVGMVALISDRKRAPYKLLMLWWFVCAFVLGCLIHVNVNRINLIFIPYIYLICEGVLFVARRVKFSAPSVAIATTAAFMLFCGAYFGSDYKANIEQRFFASYGEAVAAANQAAGDRTVYLTPVNGTEVIVLFYTKYDPHTYINSVVFRDPNAEFRPVTSFGNFVVGIPKEKEQNAVYIIKNDRLPEFKQDYEIVNFQYYSVAIGR